LQHTPGQKNPTRVDHVTGADIIHLDDVAGVVSTGSLDLGEFIVIAALEFILYFDLSIILLVEFIDHGCESFSVYTPHCMPECDFNRACRFCRSSFGCFCCTACEEGPCKQETDKNQTQRFSFSFSPFICKHGMNQPFQKYLW
jgi:hypothetical protein